MPFKWPVTHETNNKDRALWAYCALHNFAIRTSSIDNFNKEPDEVLSDLLCDLKHWANQNGVSYDECNARGNSHYIVELEEEAFDKENEEHS